MNRSAIYELGILVTRKLVDISAFLSQTFHVSSGVFVRHSIQKSQGLNSVAWRG